jgi:hypothetical protein
MSAFNLAHVRQYDWQAVARAVVDQYLVTIENHRARRGLTPLGLLEGWVERSDTIPVLPPAGPSDSGEHVMPGVVADVEAEQAIGT